MTLYNRGHAKKLAKTKELRAYIEKNSEGRRRADGGFEHGVVKELWTKRSFGLKYDTFCRFAKDKKKTLARGPRRKVDSVVREEMFNNHHLEAACGLPAPSQVNWPSPCLPVFTALMTFFLLFF